MADLHFLADEWPAISGRLDEALSLDPIERDCWLDSLAESESIKVKLRQLLADAVGVETGDFLGTLPKLGLGPAAAGDGGADGAVKGGTIGPYRLLSQLGQGGMGTVWLAERTDGQPRRKVALKLPHIGWAPGLNARMARERDILASLEHPNIARLYDAGVDPRGRPYLALEYVEGEPVDVHCKRLALPVPDRLLLVLQVARAVAHAHARLVVHRDLKPANILVSAEGQVRLLDFGIAKLMEGELTAESPLTREGGRALTLDYASPEQIRGEPIGTASDVYSLGVVAYELLTEAKPYRLKRQSAAAIEEAIESVDVRLASTAAASPQARGALKGDLDAILNKALKKDAAERYPTVEAFAQDIERHFAHMPVLARPDAPAYRMRKFLHRNKLPVAAATAVSVALLAGSAIALWQAREALREAAHAEQVKDFALSIVEGADTDAGAGAATTAADLLKTAQVRVESELSGSPETAIELMTAVGSGLLSQGRPQDGADLLRSAVERGRRELGLWHPRTLTATVVYGEALLGLDRPKEVIALLTPAVAQARRQKANHALIDALRFLSSAYYRTGDIDAGVATAQAAVAVLSSFPRDVRKVDAMNAWASLSNALNFAQREGQLVAARRSLELAKEIYGARISEPLLFARMRVAQGLATEGQDAMAIDELAAVLADATLFLGPTYPKIDVIANVLGKARFEAGDILGAVEAFRIELAASERTSGGSGTPRGIGHYVLAKALAAAGQGDEALTHFDASARLLREAQGADAAFTLRSLSARALLLARVGRLNEAESSFSALAGSPWAGAEKAQHLGRLAMLRSLQGRHDEAIALARESADGLGSHPSKIIRAVANSNLGTVLLAAGRPEDAVKPLRQAVRLYAEKQIVVSPDRAEAIAALGRAEAEIAHGAVTQAKR